MHGPNSHESGDQTNRLAEQLREGSASVADCVADHPASAVLVVFGVGFGLGLLLGHALAEPPREERHGLAALGRHVLEAMRDYAPELAKRTELAKRIRA